MTTHTPRIAIIGAGFAGLKAAKALASAPVDVTLIDQQNYHTFQALLYQVATAALEPEEIAHNVRGIFHDQANLAFRMGRVTGVDWAAKLVALESGEPVSFDYLICAAGAVTSDFGIPGVAQHAFPMKTVDEAVAIRSHVMDLFERADADPRVIEQGGLTFVVVGGGPTGVETSGALVELIHKVLRKDFPRVDVSRAKVILLEAGSALLPPFDPALRDYTAQALRDHGVEVRLDAAVVDIAPNLVWLKTGEVIPTQTVIWGAGVKAHPLAAALGVPVGRGGRIVVNDDLSLPDHPEAFAAGDIGAGKDATGAVYPQLAQAAMQSGAHAAGQILRRIAGQPGQPFAYANPGIMATIGRNKAVAQFPTGLKVRGPLAWLMWLFLHLVFLIGFRNRAQVLVNWGWNYFRNEYPGRMINNVNGGRSSAPLLGKRARS